MLDVRPQQNLDRHGNAFGQPAGHQYRLIFQRVDQRFPGPAGGLAAVVTVEQRGLSRLEGNAIDLPAAIVFLALQLEDKSFLPACGERKKILGDAVARVLIIGQVVGQVVGQAAINVDALVLVSGLVVLD